jgi:CheY-like chemotaxis protein
MPIRPALFIVVDDDAINNMLCKFSIRKHFGSIPIVTFLEAQKALDVIAIEYDNPIPRPTVLFLDIAMPSMNGWDFLDAFGQFNDTIRRQFTIYILSSSMQQSDEDKALAHPLVSGYIRKPLLESSLENILGGLASGNGKPGTAPSFLV